MLNSANPGYSGNGEPSSPIRLKAEVNTANGGIGISYSNVILAGGVDPHARGGKFESQYAHGYASLSK